jgi:putative ABC transport system permease protein
MKMNNLISGLVVTTALFSLCLKLATSNLPLPESGSIFPEAPLQSICLLVVLVGGVWAGLRRLLRSELGLLFTAVGSNPQMVTSLGKSVDRYKIAGLSLANSLTALAGALFVQWSGFFSITGNIGTLVTGIAGLILAEMIRPRFGLNLVLGAILYQALFAITIEFELQPIWNNLIKAVLIVLLIQLKPRKEAVLR